MDESPEIKDALLRFYDRLSAGDVASFDSLVSSHASTSVMGTAPGEWITERAALRFGFETEGVGLTAGAAPIAFAEGTLGCAVDEPLSGSRTDQRSASDSRRCGGTRKARGSSCTATSRSEFRTTRSVRSSRSGA